MQPLIDDVKQKLADTVPALRYIDEDWGQLDLYAPDIPAKFPCALIEVSQVAWKNQGKHVQDGNAHITIKIADMQLSRSNIKATAVQRERNKSVFELLETVHKQLHGWTARQANGPLTRLYTKRVKRDDGIRQFEIIYEVQLVDDSAKKKTIMYPMTPEKIQLETQV
jgi:hypothetical protein